MSGLYNALFGVNEMAPILLKTLGITEAEIPRYRDCFIDDEKVMIVIHTRTGGGNRDYYDELNEANVTGPWNKGLRYNPNYVWDEDDTFDSTYANFYFKFPEEYADDLKALLGVEHKLTKPSDKWKALFESMKDNK